MKHPLAAAVSVVLAVITLSSVFYSSGSPASVSSSFGNGDRWQQGLLGSGVGSGSYQQQQAASDEEHTVTTTVVAEEAGATQHEAQQGAKEQLLQPEEPSADQLDDNDEDEAANDGRLFADVTSLPPLDSTLYTVFRDDERRFRLVADDDDDDGGKWKVLAVPILSQPCLDYWLTYGELEGEACRRRAQRGQEDSGAGGGEGGGKVSDLPVTLDDSGGRSDDTADDDDRADARSRSDERSNGDADDHVDRLEPESRDRRDGDDGKKRDGAHYDSKDSLSSTDDSHASDDSLPSSSSSSSRVDFVWTWLNGSDPLWAARKHFYASHDRIGRVQAPPERHYRDHGELRAGMRAVEEALGGATAVGAGGSRFHVALTDWAHDDDERIRVGQRPVWLSGDPPHVQLAWHSSFWSDFGSASASRAEVLAASLPTFNSFSIEANLFNVPDLAPRFVYLNDDFFLTAPHSLADFHSPRSILGPLMPLIFAERNYTFPPPPPKENSGWIAWFTQSSPPFQPPCCGFINSPPQIDLSCNHEWSSLARSNHLLGKRFGHRHRPSHMHIPKPLLTPIMHEVAIIWGRDHLGRSTRRRFREDAKAQPGDYNAVWLSETLLTERSREAMLWSWAVAKLGQEAAVEGTWGHAENVYLRRMMGCETDRSKFRWWTTSPDGQEFTLNRTTTRRSLDPSHLSRIYSRLDADAPRQTTIGWTYLDGPVPPLGASIRECYVDYELCFGSWWARAMRSTSYTVDAAAMFRHLAFEKPRCGDCLLSLLVERSGNLGIRELLPRGSVNSSEPVMHRQPHMPLAADWRTTDFTYAAVTAGSKLTARDFAERLIARYAWSAVVNSSSIFSMVGSERGLESTIERIDAGVPPASAAINDDLPQVYGGGFGPGVKERLEALDRIERRFRAWLSSKWPKAGSWERHG